MGWLRRVLPTWVKEGTENLLAQIILGVAIICLMILYPVLAVAIKAQDWRSRLRGEVIAR